MSVLLIVLSVWALVAFVALVMTRALCAAAARGDAEQVERLVRRPVEAPRIITDSTPRHPTSRHPEVAVRAVARR